ncbi:MAG: hypothetical protein EPO20_14740 [Betaproteobacteria bacterium]|nr:MAG: hypothetical protein EPO20_14740 [Betaproteobacteria bacterium]
MTSSTESRNDEPKIPVLYRNGKGDWIMLGDGGEKFEIAMNGSPLERAMTAIFPSSENKETPAWIEEEMRDGDRICEAAGVQRTEGGRLPVAKIINQLGRPVPPHRSGGPQTDDIPRAESAPSSTDKVKERIVSAHIYQGAIGPRVAIRYADDMEEDRPATVLEAMLFVPSSTERITRDAPVAPGMMSEAENRFGLADRERTASSGKPDPITANPERRSSLEHSEIKPDGSAGEGRSGEVDREGGSSPATARGDAVGAGSVECGPRASGREANREGVGSKGLRPPFTPPQVNEPSI